MVDFDKYMKSHEKCQAEINWLASWKHKKIDKLTAQATVHLE